ncbi:Chemotaxis protein CheA [compost metagenome]
MLMVRGQCYPVLRLHKHYNIQTDVLSMSQGIIIMVENELKTVCLFADELLGEQQVVVKALPDYIRRMKDIQGVGGCTLLGDGSISLILDISSLMQAS